MPKHAGLFLFLLLISIGAPNLATAQSYPDSVGLEFASRMQQLIYNDRFSEADSLCLEMTRARPDDPIGHLFRATSMLARMTDAEENLFQDRFTSLLDTVDVLAHRKIPAGGRTAAWMYLFAGHTRAYRALYESRFGSFISAVKTGMEAMSFYERGLRSDSTLYDLYLGIGSYHYWKSAKAGLLRWLLIFKNEKLKGIDELRLAADSAQVFGDAARSALIWIWINENQFDSAITTAEYVRRTYPDGKSYLWPLAQAYSENRQYRNALDTYRELRRRLESDPGNYFNIVECDYRICTCYRDLHLDEEATAAARRLDEYRDEIPKKTLRRQRTNLAYLNRLRKL